jgi:hypothetical protein
MHGARGGTMTGWRDLLPIHPAAELFPLMGPNELQTLGEDIQAHGLLHNIELLSGAVIDGRSRLDAMELVGMTLEFRKRDNPFSSQIWVDRKVIGHCHHNTPIDIPDPARFVTEQNILRRHLTRDQKSELIAKLLKANPAQSDRAVAKAVKVDHKTVAAERTELEAGGEIPQVETRTGADGKTYPAKANNDEPIKPTPLQSKVACESQWGICCNELSKVRRKDIRAGILEWIEQNWHVTLKPQKSDVVAPVNEAQFEIWFNGLTDAQRQAVVDVVVRHELPEAA